MVVSVVHLSGGDGGYLEGVALFVCITTECKVEDVIGSPDEVLLAVRKLWYLTKHNCIFYCRKTCTQSQSSPVIPEACPPPSPETGNLPGRQEVSPVCANFAVMSDDS